ncbi:MAG: hypothetical protein ACLFPJ_02705, partial [Candidatus Woesearchaeota archaeon]
KYLIFVFFVVLLVLTACEPRDDDFLKLEDLRKGSDGINVIYTENSPPREVTQETNFNINAQIQNKGAYNTNGFLLLTVENDFVENDENPRKEINLDGKSLHNPDGDKKNILFNLKSKTPRAQKTKHETTVILTTCYNYSTFFQDDICIDPKAYSTTTQFDKVCEFKDETYRNQGAPIAVKKIELIPETNRDDNIKLRFNIHVENVGKGNVLGYEFIEDACSSKSVDRTKLGVVHIDQIIIGGYEYSMEGNENTIECFDDEIKLSREKGIFRCEIKNPLDSSSPEYMAQMEVKLKYGYTQSFSKSFFIERRI